MARIRLAMLPEAAAEVPLAEAFTKSFSGLTNSRVHSPLPSEAAGLVERRKLEAPQTETAEPLAPTRASPAQPEQPGHCSRRSLPRAVAVVAADLPTARPEDRQGPSPSTSQVAGLVAATTPRRVLAVLAQLEQTAGHRSSPASLEVEAVALESTRRALDSLVASAQIRPRPAAFAPCLAAPLALLAHRLLAVPVALGKSVPRVALVAAAEALAALGLLAVPVALASTVPVAAAALAQSAQRPALAALAVTGFARSLFSDHEPTHCSR